jgi:hypothetical protein
MGGRLGEPFPFPALKRAFLLVRKLRKLRNPPSSLRVEADGVRYKPPLLGDLRQGQDTRNDVVNVGVDLSGIVIKPKPPRLIRPSEQHTGIFAVVIAFERSNQFVRLHPADHANEQMIDREHAAHALDGVRLAIPRFQPEFIILAAAIARHVHEQRGQFVANQHDPMRAGLQQLS